MREPRRLNFAVVGYGKMGKLVEQVLEERGENPPVIIDPPKGYEWKDGMLENVDRAIIFTDPEGCYETCIDVLEAGCDAVVGTTQFYLLDDGGENQAMLGRFHETAVVSGTRMVYAPNFSLGVNAYLKVLETLAVLMSRLGYDPVLSEEHHVGKKDAPSGTAVKMGDVLLSAYPDRERLVIAPPEGKRGDDEISVGVKRFGDIPGTHEVAFASPTDLIRYQHIVGNRIVFANDAVKAAYMLNEIKPGLYALGDLLDSSL
ncbi:MAG: 4-hydroxy-tetrahydrodipicolinate reductase [Candidatus Thorarchaeota archaeon]|jgi:4-hydroxy-tetrahydrodipicolinate reductase